MNELQPMWKTQDVSGEAIVTVLLIAVCLIGLIIFVHRRYVRYKKERQFIDELETMEMGQTESDTLFNLVRRYALNEPVDILYSVRLFDELAVKEIERVLASPLSSDSKSKFVNLIYSIRQKTYFQELAQSVHDNNSSEDATPPAKKDAAQNTPAAAH
ncbi:MAG: hypothetical protein GC154_00610 [bacterium]|nr:hypothetical protein [bacterium]